MASDPDLSSELGEEALAERALDETTVADQQPPTRARDRLAAASAGDLELAIHKALKARDMPAVVGLLKLLAVRDPSRAQVVLDLITLGLEIRKSEEARR